MSHISSIGAGMFSDMSMTIVAGGVPATYDAAGFAAKFATETNVADSTPTAGEFVRIKNVREFPEMGTPPNIVQVPTFGQKTTQQIQGQADAPQIEVTLNYVASDWDATSGLGKYVGDGKQYIFRFALLNSEPAGYASTSGAIGTLKGGSAGTPACENTLYYWLGKIEAMSVQPSLNDSNTAKVTISVQSPFYGAYTVT